MSRTENELLQHYPTLLKNLTDLFLPEFKGEWQDLPGEDKSSLRMVAETSNIEIQQQEDIYSLTLRNTDQKDFKAPSSEALHSIFKASTEKLPKIVADAYSEASSPGADFSWNKATNRFKFYFELVLNKKDFYGLKIDKMVASYCVSNEKDGLNHFTSSLVVHADDLLFKGEMADEKNPRQLQASAQWQSPRDIFDLISPLIHERLPEWMMAREKFPLIEQLEGALYPNEGAWNIRLINHHTPWVLCQIKTFSIQLIRFHLALEPSSLKFEGSLQIGSSVLDCQFESTSKEFKGVIPEREIKPLAIFFKEKKILTHDIAQKIFSQFGQLNYSLRHNKIEFFTEKNSLTLEKAEEKQGWLISLKSKDIESPQELFLPMEIQDQESQNYNTVLSNLRHFSEIKVLNNTGIEFRNRPARIILDTSLGVHHILNQMLRTSLDNLNLPIKLIRTKKQTKLELKETSISGDLNLGIIKLKDNKLDFDIFQKQPLFVLSSTLDVGLGELIGAIQLGIHPLKLQGNFSLKESAFMLLGLKIYGLAASLQMNQGLMLGILAKFSIQQETKLIPSEDGDIKAQIDQTGIITQFNAVLPENKAADLETLVKCLIPMDQRDSQFESVISNIKKVFPTSLGPIEDKAFLDPLAEKSSTDATIRELLSEAKKLVIKFERGSGGLLDWQLKFLGQFNTFGLCAFLMLDVAIKSGVRLIGGAKKTNLFGGLIQFGKMITPMDYKPPINIEGPAIYLNMRYNDLQNFRFYINSSITLLGLTSESLIDVSTEGLSFDFKFNCRLSWFNLEEKTTVKLDSNEFHFNAHPKLSLTIDIAGQSIPLIGIGMGLFVRYANGSMNIVIEVDIPGTNSKLRLPSILCTGTNFNDILSLIYQPIFDAVKSALVDLPKEKLKEVFEHIPQLAGQAIDIAQKIHQGSVFVVTEVVTQRFVQPVEQTVSLITQTGQALNPLRLLSPSTPSRGTETRTDASSSSSSSTSSTSTSILKAFTGGWF